MLKLLRVHHQWSHQDLTLQGPGHSLGKVVPEAWMLIRQGLDRPHGLVLRGLLRELPLLLKGKSSKREAELATNRLLSSESHLVGGNAWRRAVVQRQPNFVMIGSVRIKKSPTVGVPGEE